MNTTPEYLRRDQAAEYLRSRYGFCTPKSLAKADCLGQGPTRHAAGRMVLYKICDLDAWAQAKITPANSPSAEPVAA